MNELATIPQSQELATRDPESILRYALERGASVDVIERLMAVRRELQAEAAKSLFDKALSDFQASCPPIAKTKFGAKNAYKYAPLDDIIAQTKDLMKSCGFSYSLTSLIEQGWVMAQCKITHSGGHSEVSEFKVPIDTKNPMMTEPQRYGGAMTFAKRYALCNGFGIVTADEDTDARADRSEGKSEPQKKRTGLDLDEIDRAHRPDPTLRESVTPSEAKAREAVLAREQAEAHVREAQRLEARIALKKRIWDRCKQYFRNNSTALENWLVLNSLLVAGESLATLPEDRLEVIAERVEEEFDAPGF